MQPRRDPRNIDLIDTEAAGTIPGMMLRRAERSPDRVAYSEHTGGEWHGVTWREVALLVGRYRAALDRAGIQRGDRVAVMLPNCVDWVAFDLAAMANGLITVPLYPHDSTGNIGFILSSTQSRICLTGEAETKTLAAALSASGTSCQVWRRGSGGLPDGVDGVRIGDLSEVLGGMSEDPGPPRCAADETATIIYTSGTTGQPKGAMLTHRALLWDAAAVADLIPPLTSDVFLSLLPLAHAFERTMTYHLAIMGGAHVAFARSVTMLRKDLVEVRPTILTAVPRLYERLYEAILRQAGRSPAKRQLAERAASIGWRLFEARHGRAPPPAPITRLLLWPLLDRLVARPVRQAFGGRMRAAVSGGASLSTEVSHFLIGLGVPVVEGYGLTEAAPVVAATTFEDSFPGSVGRPLPGIDFRLGADGELIIRSPALMQGYWQAPELSAEAIDDGGWFHTGDSAEIRDGRLYITGRVKDLLVLSTGKKVAAAVLETAVAANPLFEQCCVFGNDRPAVVAVAVVNDARWTELAGREGLEPASPNTPDASALLLAQIQLATENQPSYGQIRAVHAVLTPWSVEDGGLTPTLKVKRAVIGARYRTEIAALYADLHAKRSAGR